MEPKCKKTNILIDSYISLGIFQHLDITSSVVLNGSVYIKESTPVIQCDSSSFKCMCTCVDNRHLNARGFPSAIAEGSEKGQIYTIITPDEETPTT